MGELPPQVQNMIAQLQTTQQQLQMVVSQKLQLENALREIEEAIKEVEKASEDTPIYKTVGTVLVKTKKDEVLKELNEKKETIEVRIRALSRQEEKLKERLQELQNKVKSMLSGVQAG
ncbi:prefoldin subunit beta [Archaeoglobus profundus]|uniref:Prefoldin subunit beta n=1 Tax=Archaeoglobus profundus (strain DSM 5631 / JCM 9629 / NBRC 100127 / Av18) TaxID=572546 RepID=D2RF06_ARCPA|nr:prefoldin subunit beta [Archaeoglobus profundus]ADB58700.1 prefoldin, beta subunit [Archaeoglobus profundus DSM 5631]